jgi:hypothetical protein
VAASRHDDTPNHDHNHDFAEPEANQTRLNPTATPEANPSQSHVD